MSENNKSNKFWFGGQNTNNNATNSGQSIPDENKNTTLTDESDAETDERLAAIFNRLDRNNIGRIDVQDLTAALKDFGMSKQYAEVTSNRNLYFFFRI